jgi:DNA mismatch repair ATPase MutL
MSSTVKIAPIKYLPIADREKMLADVVIIGWSTIVEELVLNAVDAGARNVKIWSVFLSRFSNNVCTQ